MWAVAPALTTAIDDLLARGGIGAPVGKGIDRVPHVGAASSQGKAVPFAVASSRWSTGGSASLVHCS